MRRRTLEAGGEVAPAGVGFVRRGHRAGALAQAGSDDVTFRFDQIVAQDVIAEIFFRDVNTLARQFPLIQ